MSVCKDYTAEQERVELLELAGRYCVAMDFDDSDEDLEKICRIWSDSARRDNVPVLDMAREIVADTEFERLAQIEFAEFETKLNDEATTCVERRTRTAEYLGQTLEEYEKISACLYLHLEELEWLQFKTKTQGRRKDLEAWAERYEELEDRLLSMGWDYSRPPSEEVRELKKTLRTWEDALEKAVIAEKRRLERKLLVMTLKARRPAIFRLKVYMPSFRRARTRAPRSARRASFSMAASSPGGGGDSSGESDQGDPPGAHPFRTFVTPSSNCNPNQRPLRPWLGLGCCRMERGRSAW